MNGKPIKLEPMALYRGTCFEAHLGPGVTWMHVQEYDFNDPRGHFFVKKEDVDTEDGRWPDIGDQVMLVCTEAGDSFGCVVIVIKAEDSVRDGYVRYETDLGQRMAQARKEADE